MTMTGIPLTRLQACHEKRRRRRAAVMLRRAALSAAHVALSVLTLGAWPFVCRAHYARLCRWAESYTCQPGDPSRLRRCHAILVPGAGVDAGMQPRPLFQARLEAALHCWRLAHESCVIIVSGDGVVGEDRAGRDWLVERGVSPGVIVADGDGFCTRRSAVNCARMLEDGAVVVACTQALFMPRLLALLHDAGVSAVGAPCASLVSHARRREYLREVAACAFLRCRLV